MARPSGPKTRCNGEWTEARYKNFIISLLRRGTSRWAPKQLVKKEARVSRGIYICAYCKEEVPTTIKSGRKREQNIFVDHIEPIVDPNKGFTTWDEYVERMFCEKENLQLLCKACHDDKTAGEKEIAKNRRRKEKDNE
jgi:5-methylcytosine-specific restriction endonuclease McrA